MSGEPKEKAGAEVVAALAEEKEKDGVDEFEVVGKVGKEKGVTGVVGIDDVVAREARDVSDKLPPNENTAAGCCWLGC